MEKILKTGCILMVVFFVAITFGAVTEQDVYAGGGINYLVTVSNPTDSKCRVNVFVATGAKSFEVVTIPVKSLGWVTIQPGGSYTWHTKGQCPSGLWGSYWDKKYNIYRRLRTANMLCRSATFRVCRKSGQGDEVKDNDYGFCKE